MNMRRPLRRWRRKGKPEEQVFERFSERFDAPASRKGDARQGPRKERPADEAIDAHDAPSERQDLLPTEAVSALDILGVSRGATTKEVGAAYRKLARAHHPDRVANEPRLGRVESERRMKEIYAAYAVLRRRWNGPATVGAKAG